MKPGTIYNRAITANLTNFIALFVAKRAPCRRRVPLDINLRYCDGAVRRPIRLGRLLRIGSEFLAYPKGPTWPAQLSNEPKRRWEAIGVPLKSRSTVMSTLNRRASESFPSSPTNPHTTIAEELYTMHPPAATGSALCRLGTRRASSTACPAGNMLRRCAGGGIRIPPPPQASSTFRTTTTTSSSSFSTAAAVPTLPSFRSYQSYRSFHSRDHPPPPGPFGDTEAALLAAAYKHVPEHGFTVTALALGARDAGFPDISTSVLPDGEFGLIRWHLVTQQEALAARARELFGEEGGEGERNTYTIPEKVEMLIWERIMGNKEVIGQWQQVRLP